MLYISFILYMDMHIEFFTELIEILFMRIGLVGNQCCHKYRIDQGGSHLCIN